MRLWTPLHRAWQNLQELSQAGQRGRRRNWRPLREGCPHVSSSFYSLSEQKHLPVLLGGGVTALKGQGWWAGLALSGVFPLCSQRAMGPERGPTGRGPAVSLSSVFFPPFLPPGSVTGPAVCSGSMSRQGSPVRAAEMAWPGRDRLRPHWCLHEGWSWAFCRP